MIASEFKHLGKEQLKRRVKILNILIYVAAAIGSFSLPSLTSFYQSIMLVRSAGCERKSIFGKTGLGKSRKRLRILVINNKY